MQVMQLCQFLRELSILRLMSEDFWRFRQPKNVDRYFGETSMS